MSSSSRAAGRATLTWLRERDEEQMVKQFDEVLVQRFGIDMLKAHVDEGSKHKHAIVHDLVRSDKRKVMKHLVEKHGFDINIQRASDLCTPLHLALWQSREAMAKLLVELGADQSIKNKHGEDAHTPTQKPARIRFTTDPQDILSLVNGELGGLSSTDTVTVYYNLAKAFANYDAEFCDWHADHAVVNVLSHPSCRKLADACANVLFAEDSAESGDHWATIVKALAMLPDTQLIELLTIWVTANRLPVRGWSALHLTNVAWGIAEIRGGGRLWAVCYDILGNELADRFDQLEQRHVSSIVWAFGKAGTRHNRLFDAAAAFFDAHSEELTSAQTVSSCAWAFAKLGEQRPSAFHKLALAAIRLMPEFADQNVANTAWAYASLGLVEQDLFVALMDKAHITLYEDKYRDHVRMSPKVKLIHWCQIHRAYQFCCVHCPAVLHNLPERLLMDLQKIGTGRNAGDGLSEGSGVETVERLRELDRLIADMGDERME